jgi:hypothetical protein
MRTICQDYSVALHCMVRNAKNDFAEIINPALKKCVKKIKE